MTRPTDTSTTLNSGSGGSVMDETLIDRAGDGSVLVKRTRVVPGSDDGELQTFAHLGAHVGARGGVTRSEAHVADVELRELVEQLLLEQKVTSGYLKIIAAALTGSGGLTRNEALAMSDH